MTTIETDHMNEAEFQRWAAQREATPTPATHAARAKVQKHLQTAQDYAGAARSATTARSAALSTLQAMKAAGEAAGEAWRAQMAATTPGDWRAVSAAWTDVAAATAAVQMAADEAADNAAACAAFGADQT